MVAQAEVNKTNEDPVFLNFIESLLLELDKIRTDNDETRKVIEHAKEYLKRRGELKND